MSVTNVSSSDIFTDLQKWCAHKNIICQEYISAKKYTTFCIGGSFRILVEVQDEGSLQAICTFLLQSQIPYRVIGAGSNLLVHDQGVNECIIKLGKGFRSVRALKEEYFEVGGGTSLMTLCRDLSDEGFSGLEFAGGIPGSVGGAVRMNAGAHGGETVNVLSRISYVSPEGELENVSSSTFEFSYRHSTLPHGSIVTKCELKLTKDPTGNSKILRATYLAERKKRQPLAAPSAGSVFKNPPTSSAGALIEQAGLKGHQKGGAKVSELHGNWIINPQKTASFQDVVSLIEVCQSLVKERSGILLEPEIIRWQ